MKQTYTYCNTIYLSVHLSVTVAAAGGDGDVDAVKDGGGRGAWKARNHRTNASLYDNRRRPRFSGLLSHACH